MKVTAQIGDRTTVEAAHDSGGAGDGFVTLMIEDGTDGVSMAETVNADELIEAISRARMDKNRHAY